MLLQNISLTHPFGRLRLIGYLEGISYLVLLGVAMPLKYIAGEPSWVRVTGVVHGLLFVLYALGIMQAAIEYRWSGRTVGMWLLASILPFGPFYIESRLRHGTTGGETVEGDAP